MTLLIGVKSCQRDREEGFHQAIRETWGHSYGFIRFFMGGDKTTAQDEVALGCADDYMSLPYKTKAMLEWFLKHTSSDHIFLCDCDTFVDVRKLLVLPFEKYDYSGKSTLWPPNAKMGETFRYHDGKGNIIDPCHPWASGGYGYFLSRRAAQIVVENTPNTWAEDLWVGQVLGPRLDITKYDYPDYHNNVTWHWYKPVAGKFTVSELHNAFVNKPQGRKWGMR